MGMKVVLVLLFFSWCFLVYHMRGNIEGYLSSEECVQLCPQDCENPVVRAALRYTDENKCKAGCGSSYCPTGWWAPLLGRDVGALLDTIW
mgnify:CR=1 FL=1